METQISHMMDFSDAILLLKNGAYLSRAGWNGKGLFIALQVPDENSKMTRPYIYITTPSRSTAQFGAEEAIAEQRVPWICSQTDLLATDWFEVVSEGVNPGQAAA